MKRSLKNARVYLVLDAQVQGYDELWKILKQSVDAGVDVVQLRDKNGEGRDTLRFAKQAMEWIDGRAVFIVNDRLDLALACGADGVHLGQEDMPVKTARKIVGKKMLIGASCQTLAQLKKAQEDRADYVGFGSVFKTLTKPQRHPMDLRLLRKAYQQSKIPVFAIGGITLDKMALLKQYGVNRVAVTRAVCLSKNPGQVVKRFKVVTTRG